MRIEELLAQADIKSLYDPAQIHSLVRGFAVKNTHKEGTEIDGLYIFTGR